MPLALRSSELTPCEPSLSWECVMVSTHFAQREQRSTSTRGGAGSAYAVEVFDGDWDSSEEVDDSDEVRWE